MTDVMIVETLAVVILEIADSSNLLLLSVI